MSEKTTKSPVRAMFDRIAPSYDMLNHLLSLGIDHLWRRRAVRELRMFAPKRVLDLATGTCDLAIAIAKGIEDVKVMGTDISTEMVEVGRVKVAKRGLSEQIELGIADAENLPYGEGEFDAVTVGFGVRNFSNKEQGLSEMARVLRSGGVVEILEFSRPNNKIFAPIFRFYFHKVMPVVGGWISGDRAAYDYLPASVDKFPSPERFVEMMREAGLQECRAKRLTFGVAYIYIGVKR